MIITITPKGSPNTKLQFYWGGDITFSQRYPHGHFFAVKDSTDHTGDYTDALELQKVFPNLFIFDFYTECSKEKVSFHPNHEMIDTVEVGY